MTFKKDPTTKIKDKTLKQLKDLKGNEFIDNKLYYQRKPTDSPVPKFYGQPNIRILGVPIYPIVSSLLNRTYSIILSKDELSKENVVKAEWISGKRY